MQSLLEVILPVFLVIGAGYLAVWRGYFSDDNVDGLMKFTQNFAIPCLLYSAMASIELDSHFNFALLFSFYAGSTTGFLLGLAGARLIFHREWPDCVAVGFCCLYSNSLLLGLPITERAYGPDALAGNFAIIAIHAPYAYLLGVTVMESVKGAGESVGRTVRNVLTSMFQNALIVGIALGLLVNILNLPVPSVLGEAVDLIAKAGLPAALFGLGGVLVRYRPEGDAKVIAMVCAISLIVHPAISWSLSSAFHLDRDAFRSVVLTAAMAPGSNAYIFANMYGAARRVAASSVLISTVLSVMTIWLWLLFIP